MQRTKTLNSLTTMEHHHYILLNKLHSLEELVVEKAL